LGWELGRVERAERVAERNRGFATGGGRYVKVWNGGGKAARGGMEQEDSRGDWGPKSGRKGEKVGSAIWV